MVVGNGLIANAFKKYKDDNTFIFFASGVSNSKSATEKDYLREENLINEHLTRYPNFLFIYFSTTSILHPDMKQSEYALHKLKMESIIEAKAKKYLILRLSNVVGPTKNIHTIFNHIRFTIENNQKLNLWANAKRNLIDIDDVVRITEILLVKNTMNKINNIVSPYDYSPSEIAFSIGKKLNIEPIIEMIDKGDSIEPIEVIDNEIFTDYKDQQHYLNSLINKYVV